MVVGAGAVRFASGRELPADLVLLGLGVWPTTRLAQEAGLTLGPQGGIAVEEYLQTSDPAIYALGDAVEYPVGPTGQPMQVRSLSGGQVQRSRALAASHCGIPRVERSQPASKDA